MGRNRVDANDEEAFWTFIRPFLLPLLLFPASTHLTQKHYSALPPFLPLERFLSLFSVLLSPSPPPPKKKSQTPCLPLTLMPTSLSLPSSAPPPPHPSLHFTPFWLCPHHYVFPPATPLCTHSNSALAASASPPLLLSCTPTAESSTARY